MIMESGAAMGDSGNGKNTSDEGTLMLPLSDLSRRQKRNRIRRIKKGTLRPEDVFKKDPLKEWKLRKRRLSGNTVSPVVSYQIRRGSSRENLLTRNRSAKLSSRSGSADSLCSNPQLAGTTKSRTPPLSLKTRTATHTRPVPKTTESKKPSRAANSDSSGSTGSLNVSSGTRPKKLQPPMTMVNKNKGNSSLEKNVQRKPKSTTEDKYKSTKKGTLKCGSGTVSSKSCSAAGLALDVKQNVSDVGNTNRKKRSKETLSSKTKTDKGSGTLKANEQAAVLPCQENIDRKKSASKTSGKQLTICPDAIKQSPKPKRMPPTCQTDMKNKRSLQNTKDNIISDGTKKKNPVTCPKTSSLKPTISSIQKAVPRKPVSMSKPYTRKHVSFLDSHVDKLSKQHLTANEDGDLLRKDVLLGKSSDITEKNKLPCTGQSTTLEGTSGHQPTIEASVDVLRECKEALDMAACYGSPNSGFVVLGSDHKSALYSTASYDADVESDGDPYNSGLDGTQANGTGSKGVGLVKQSYDNEPCNEKSTASENDAMCSKTDCQPPQEELKDVSPLVLKGDKSLIPVDHEDSAVALDKETRHRTEDDVVFSPKQMTDFVSAEPLRHSDVQRENIELKKLVVSHSLLQDEKDFENRQTSKKDGVFKETVSWEGNTKMVYEACLLDESPTDELYVKENESEIPLPLGKKLSTVSAYEKDPNSMRVERDPDVKLPMTNFEPVQSMCSGNEGFVGSDPIFSGSDTLDHYEEGKTDRGPSLTHSRLENLSSDKMSSKHDDVDIEMISCRETNNMELENVLALFDDVVKYSDEEFAESLHPSAGKIQRDDAIHPTCLPTNHEAELVEISSKDKLTQEATMSDHGDPPHLKKGAPTPPNDTLDDDIIIVTKPVSSIINKPSAVCYWASDQRESVSKHVPGQFDKIRATPWQPGIPKEDLKNQVSPDPSVMDEQERVSPQLILETRQEPATEQECTFPQLTLMLEQDTASHQHSPLIEQKPVSPQLTPTVEQEPILPQLSPSFKLDSISPQPVSQLEPAIEQEPVSPQLTPVIRQEPVPLQLTSMVELEAVSQQLTQVIEQEPVSPQLTPVIGQEPVPPQLTSMVELEAASQQLTPVIEREPVSPQLTPMVEQEAVSLQMVEQDPITLPLSSMAKQESISPHLSAKIVQQSVSPILTPPGIEKEPISSQLPPAIERTQVSTKLKPRIEQEPVSPQLTSTTEQERVSTHLNPSTEQEPVLLQLSPMVLCESGSFQKSSVIGQRPVGPQVSPTTLQKPVSLNQVVLKPDSLQQSPTTIQEAVSPKEQQGTVQKSDSLQLAPKGVQETISIRQSPIMLQEPIEKMLTDLATSNESRVDDNFTTNTTAVDGCDSLYIPNEYHYTFVGGSPDSRSVVDGGGKAELQAVDEQEGVQLLSHFGDTHAIHNVIGRKQDFRDEDLAAVDVAKDCSYSLFDSGGEGLSDNCSHESVVDTGGYLQIGSSKDLLDHDEVLVTTDEDDSDELVISVSPGETDPLLTPHEDNPGLISVGEHERHESVGTLKGLTTSENSPFDPSPEIHLPVHGDEGDSCKDKFFACSNPTTERMLLDFGGFESLEPQNYLKAAPPVGGHLSPDSHKLLMSAMAELDSVLDESEEAWLRVESEQSDMTNKIESVATGGTLHGIDVASTSENSCTQGEMSDTVCIVGGDENGSKSNPSMESSGEMNWDVIEYLDEKTGQWYCVDVAEKARVRNLGTDGDGNICHDTSRNTLDPNIFQTNSGDNLTEQSPVILQRGLGIANKAQTTTIIASPSGSECEIFDATKIVEKPSENSTSNNYADVSNSGVLFPSDSNGGNNLTNITTDDCKYADSNLTVTASSDPVIRQPSMENLMDMCESDSRQGGFETQDNEEVISSTEECQQGSATPHSTLGSTSAKKSLECDNAGMTHKPEIETDIGDCLSSSPTSNSELFIEFGAAAGRELPSPSRKMDINDLCSYFDSPSPTFNYDNFNFGEGAQESDELTATTEGESATTSQLGEQGKMGNTVDVQVMESVEVDEDKGEKRKSREVSEFYQTKIVDQAGTESTEHITDEPTSPGGESTISSIEGETEAEKPVKKGKDKAKKEKKEKPKKKEKKEKKEKHKSKDEKKDKSKNKELFVTTVPPPSSDAPSQEMQETPSATEQQEAETLQEVDSANQVIEVKSEIQTETLPEVAAESQMVSTQQVTLECQSETTDQSRSEDLSMDTSTDTGRETTPTPSDDREPTPTPSGEWEQQNPISENEMMRETFAKDVRNPFDNLDHYEGWTERDPNEHVEVPPSVDRVEQIVVSPTIRTSVIEEEPVTDAVQSSPDTDEDPGSPISEDSIEPVSVTRKKFIAPDEPINIQTDQQGLSYRPTSDLGQSPRLSPISPLTPSCGVMSYSRPASSLESEPSPNNAAPPPLNLSHVSADIHHNNIDNAIAESERSSVDSGTGSDPTRHHGHFVVVAIDFGTTFSGYAFSFTRDPDSIHMMRKWEGGDPGVINQKTPTCLLMTPEGEFHSFGFAARDFFHDLDPQESKKWLYFEKFKMALHYNADLGKDTMLKASNGKQIPALTVFSYALRFFKEHALQELTDQSATKILNDDVRWVITVPAIWKEPAKHFMRTSAYQAGIASSEFPDQLLIALEPEAASIFCRKLRMHQLVPDAPPPKRPLSPRKDGPHEPINMDPVSENFHEDSFFVPASHIDYTDTQQVESLIKGVRYMVVDCGGGTVDMTVHEIDYNNGGGLRELWKASGGPYGSVGVDLEFEKLLTNIFGVDFMEAFKYKRPAGYVDLMIAFESRKRTASPWKGNALNVSLPFSFIDYYKKYKGSAVENAIRKYGDKDIRWSSQGMMRFTPDAMRRLFLPTLDRIKQAIGDVLNNPAVKDVHYMFLVGGFAESPILQYDMKNEFGHLLRIIIPQDVSQTILKGAVLFGLDPTVVTVRRCRMTYGVGVLNRYVATKHPKEKRISKDGQEWCTDVFDKFVAVDQSVALGDTVLRSYTPAKAGQKNSIINIYCSEKDSVKFITDNGVRKCGTLCLDLSDIQYQTLPKRREIQTRMTFGDTEIKVSSLDVATGKCVKAAIDFLNK